MNDMVRLSDVEVPKGLEITGGFGAWTADTGDPVWVRAVLERTAVVAHEDSIDTIRFPRWTIRNDNLLAERRCIELGYPPQFVIGRTWRTSPESSRRGRAAQAASRRAKSQAAAK